MTQTGMKQSITLYEGSSMKKNRKLFLTEEQARELLEGYGGPEQQDMDTAAIRNERLLKHYHFSLFTLTGTHS